MKTDLKKAVYGYTIGPVFGSALARDLMAALKADVRVQIHTCSLLLE